MPLAGGRLSGDCPGWAVAPCADPSAAGIAVGGEGLNNVAAMVAPMVRLTADGNLVTGLDRLGGVAFPVTTAGDGAPLLFPAADGISLNARNAVFGGIP